MGNDLIPPSPAELEAERGRRMAAEAEANRMAEITRQAIASRGAPPPPEPDPLAKFSAEAAQLTPEAATELLDKGINRRVIESETRTKDQIGRAIGRELFARDQAQALDAVIASNPDIADDQEGFFAAASRITFRESQPGAQKSQTNGEFYRKAVREYRTSKKPPTPVDHVEGGSAGEGAALPTPPRPAPTEEEQYSPMALQYSAWYGMHPSEVQAENTPEGRATLEKMSRDYPAERNDYLESKGVFSKVPAVEMPQKQRRVDRKRAASAAGG